MGGMFKKPDMSAQVAQQERALKLQELSMQRQEKILKEQEIRLQNEERDKMKQLEARRRAMSRGGRAMLLSPEREVSELGLAQTKDTLGG